MLRTFIQVTALILTLEAAFFLAKGNLSLSPSIIAELSATKFGYNSSVVDSFCKQKADTWVGVIFLLVAFILQLFNSLWKMRIKDFDVNRRAVIGAISICILVFFIGLYCSSNMASKEKVKVQEILKPNN